MCQSLSCKLNMCIVGVFSKGLHGFVVTSLLHMARRGMSWRRWCKVGRGDGCMRWTRCEVKEGWIWEEAEGRRSAAQLKLARGEKRRYSSSRREDEGLQWRCKMLGEWKLVWQKTLSQGFVSSEGPSRVSVLQLRAWSEGKVSSNCTEGENKGWNCK